MSKICRLSESPSSYEATIALIENSFKYSSAHSFRVDFAPLVDESNFSNCYISISSEGEILAHIGVSERKILIEDEEFPVILLGGIAVSEKHRGKGHFQALFQEVISEKRSDASIFLLWSDLEDLYRKYSFFLCGDQWELKSSGARKNDFIKTTLISLTEDHKEQVRVLFTESFSRHYLTLQRSREDWKLLEKITSADLFIRKQGEKISDYFFINKGQDLPNVIYEYGTSAENLEAFIKEISAFGNVWTGRTYEDSQVSQFQFLLSPGDPNKFSKFVERLSQGKISVKRVNVLKEEVIFDFNDELLSLEMEEFIRGIFGPGTFEELTLPALFISGLDSI